MGTSACRYVCPCQIGRTLFPLSELVVISYDTPRPGDVTAAADAGTARPSGPVPSAPRRADLLPVTSWGCEVSVVMSPIQDAARGGIHGDISPVGIGR